MIVPPEKLQGKNSEERLGIMFGINMQKSWAEIFHIECLQLDRRFKRIIEIGTGTGAVTCYLGMLGVLNDIRIFSYDIGSMTPLQKMNHKVYGLLRHLGVFYQQEDVFRNIEEIGRVLGSEGKTLLYLDNGNKQVELETFTPFLKKDDMVLIHDYSTEITKKDLDNIGNKYGLQQLYENEFKKYNTLHACMVKK